MRRLTVLLLACFVLSGMAVAEASAGALGFAVDDGFQAATTTSSVATATALSTLNASWVRVDVRWNTIALQQPANARLPRDAAYSWAAVDAAVVSARSLVIPSSTGTPGPPQILLSIGGTPDWARSDGGRGGSPGDPAWAPKRAAFQNFVAAVVARYGTQVGAYEIWPNPNSGAGLRPQRAAGRLIAAGLFRVLVRYATVEIRKVTTAPVISGGLARTDPANAADTPAIPFLRAMGRTRLVVDAVGLRLQPPTGIESPADPSNLALSDPNTIVANVDTFFPGQAKGLWATGYALSSATDPATQAAGVTAFLGAAVNPRFGVSIWNNLVDTASAPGYGLFTGATVLDASTRTPAWTTWTSIIAPPPIPG